ncbi:protein of unknown function [Cupriavidus taiwanensis]|uniref:Uncharacterized protein n=1 Tax=Cupriavidus taiwanensis TaxID=164546 RepID=A0A7Z7NL42_9BURK|nr:protein of unknown function [Cupriavidus taiwanensis]SOZ07364.1 hypothetical protein CBM2597_A60048 [Cupriavidus taiwanensis]SPC09779.1 hypothetical protein CBM2594_A41102 [Cupriavidus taiwanensis]
MPTPSAWPRPSRWTGWCGGSALLGFERKPGAVVLPEQVDQYRHGLLQRFLQPPRRVDDEHAAAVQPQAAFDRALDRQGHMEPALERQALELHRQLHRFAPLHLRVPDRIDAGGKTFQPVAHGLHGACVVLLVFVGRIDQHQCAPRRRGQDGLDAAEAVAVVQHHAAPGAAEVVAQDLDLGAVQLEQPQAVVLAQHLPGQPRRARVVAQAAVRIERAHLVQVFVQHRREFSAARGGAPQRRDAGLELGLLLRVGVVQRIKAGAGMGVDVPERLVLLRQVREQLHHNGVLEDIGVIAGMEGVTIAEHVEQGALAAQDRGRRRRPREGRYATIRRESPLPRS